MSDKIVKFYKQNAAESADAVLEQAVGNYSDVIVLGWDKSGKLDVRATLVLEADEILWIIEVFKMKLLRGDYGKA